MKLRSYQGACVVLAATMLAACDFGGNLGLENGQLTADVHYNLRTDGLVQETLDGLDALATKAKGELIKATGTSDLGLVTSQVIDKLPPDADVVFVIDTTASMLWAVESVKLAVSISMKAQPNRNYGLVVFRDRGDSYVEKGLAPLSPNLMASLSALDSMSAWEGGDFPESVAVGIDAGLNQPWRTDKEKHMILIGDAPDHEYADSPITMDSIAQKATELGVIIHAIGVPCGDTCKTEIGAM